MFLALAAVEHLAEYLLCELGSFTVIVQLFGCNVTEVLILSN